MIPKNPKREVLEQFRPPEGNAVEVMDFLH